MPGAGRARAVAVHPLPPPHHLDSSALRRGAIVGNYKSALRPVRKSAVDRVMVAPGFQQRFNSLLIAHHILLRRSPAEGHHMGGKAERVRAFGLMCFLGVDISN